MTSTSVLPGALQTSPRAVRFEPGPWAGRYPAAAAMVILFLTPYLVLSSALQPIAPFIAAQLHMSVQSVNLTSGMANAGYTAGTVIAVQFSQLLPQRRMLLVYGTLLIVGSVLAAAAADPAMFIVGTIMQGLCTSLLLIAAAPPLFLAYGPKKFPITVVILDMGVFGAVTAGPLIGGVQASFHAWRPLFWIVTGVAVLALVLSLLTFEDAPPANPSAPRDPAAIGLATAGSFIAYWGAAELASHQFWDPVAAAPLLGGIALIVAMLVYQYRAKNPLLMVRNLASTIPLSAIVAAVCTAAAGVSAVTLADTVLAPRYSPPRLGLLFAPELGGAVVAAAVLGLVIRRRVFHFFVLAGMVLLAAGILMLLSAAPPTAGLVLAGSALVGMGLGAAVTPALFLIGFSLRAPAIQRVFSFSEMLRAVAAFLLAPILLHFAVTAAGQPTASLDTALWICFGIAAGGALAGVVLYRLGGVRLAAPELTRWMAGKEIGWYSPPLLAALHPDAAGPAAAGTPGQARAGSHNGERIADQLASLPLLRLSHGHGDKAGPVVIAYDGSDLAKAAIAEAGRQLPGKRAALVLTAWQTYNVGFLPVPGAKFDAACADEVKQEAERTAAEGTALAAAAGFRAQACTVESAPTWQGIIDTADDNQASMIVIGSPRRRTGLGLIGGSVVGAVAARSPRPVLIIRDPADNPAPAQEAPVPAAAPSPDQPPSRSDR